MRLWVRSVVWINTLHGFSKGGDKHTSFPLSQRDFAIAWPIPPNKMFPWVHNVNKKRERFLGLTFAFRVAYCYQKISPWLRNFDLIAFLANCKSSVRKKSLSIRVGLPMYKGCSHGTLLHFNLQNSRLNICYYHQDLHRLRLDAS